MKNQKNTDSMVLDLFNKVREKKKEIAILQKPKWETSCTIGFNPEIATDRINIQVVNDINKLIDIHAFLLMKLHFWQRSIDILDIYQTFKWMGYSVAEWEADIKTRVSQIGINAKKKDLEVLESRLNALITVEQRREMELADITNELKNHL